MLVGVVDPFLARSKRNDHSLYHLEGTLKIASHGSLIWSSVMTLLIYERMSGHSFLAMILHRCPGTNQRELTQSHNWPSSKTYIFIDAPSVVFISIVSGEITHL